MRTSLILFKKKNKDNNNNRLDKNSGVVAAFAQPVRVGRDTEPPLGDYAD
jgi:hypothetical protein